MAKAKRRKHPVIDRTYRTSAVAGSYWTVARPLLGRLVVVYMPETDSWKGGYLYGLIPADDIFLVKWKKDGAGSILPGIWRVHNRVLFTGTRLLPIPRFPARLPQSTTSPKEDEVATRKTTAKTKAASTKTKRTAKPAVEDSGNGAKKSTGRTRGPDKLEGLSDAKKRNIAKLIYRERSKSPATSWPDIIEMVQDKYDWTLPGSMTGRRLLREHGPDDAEQAIIKQDKAKSDKAKATKTKPPKSVKAKKGAVVDEEEDEDEDLEDEDEDIEDEVDDDEEMEEDEDEDEDEDLDEDEEEEEPEPAPKAKRVRVTKGRGKKANPSK